MSCSLRSSYLCLQGWGRHIYLWKFKTKYDDLKLPSINMMTSNFKTSIWRPQAARHKYDDLKLQEVVIFIFESLKSSYLCLEVWSHHIYVWKFEVIIFMSWSLRSSYLCLEVWGRYILSSSLRSSYLCLNMTTSNFQT
jgi:hypothetical protein